MSWLIDGEIVKALRDADVEGPHDLFPNRDGALVERRRIVAASHGLVGGREVLEAVRQRDVVHRCVVLADGDGAFVERHGFRVFPLDHVDAREGLDAVGEDGILGVESALPDVHPALVQGHRVVVALLLHGEIRQHVKTLDQTGVLVAVRFRFRKGFEPDQLCVGVPTLAIRLGAVVEVGSRPLRRATATDEQ